jgi:hypothetical protein
MSTASFQAVGDEGPAPEAATHTELHGRDDPAQNDRAKRALLLRSGPRRVSGSHGLKRLVSIEQSSLIDSDETPRWIISVRVLPRCCPRRTPGVREV